MKKVKKFLVPTLLVVFLMLTVVGSAPASDKQAPLAQGGKIVTVSAADCIANHHSCQYTSGGFVLSTESWACTFNCPVHFPEYGGHWVYAVYVYVHDNNNTVGQEICAGAFRTDPQTGSQVQMGEVCSSGASPAHVRTYTMSGGALLNRWVLPRNGMYITLNIPAGTDLSAYGMKVMYFM